MTAGVSPAMTPLAPDAIRARSRPAALLFVFFAELAWALLVATPVHAWARHVWGAHPSGDAVLFEGGNRELLVWLGQTDAAMSVTARTTMVLLVVGMVVMQLPLGALIASLAFERESGRPLRLIAALRVSAGAFLPLSAVLALGALTAIIVLVIGAFASSALDHGLVESLGDARAFTVRLVVLGLFAAIAAVIGVFVDLARAAIGREAGLCAVSGTSAPAWSMMLRGLRTALTTSRRSLGRATAAWAARAAIGAALIAIGYIATQSLGGHGGAALIALFVAHQGIILGRVALRASWLARALALVGPVQDAHNSTTSAVAPAEPPADDP